MENNDNDNDKDVCYNYKHVVPPSLLSSPRLSRKLGLKGLHLI
jgi:hypothetical protein